MLTDTWLALHAANISKTFTIVPYKTYSVAIVFVL